MGVQEGANAPPIFLPSKTTFFTTALNRANNRIESFQNDYLGGVKTEKKPAFYGTVNRGL